MTEVPRSLAEHWLNIQEGYTPVRQKKKGQALERAKAIQAEVQKLVEAGIIREVHYHDWLSNPVMVKKHDSSWRMCMDFTGLNKACPQDCYPLPEIDWKVESLCGYPFNPEGIKPCPDKTEAVLQLPSSRTIKEVQSLNGKLASLNRSGTSHQATKIALVKATPAGSTQTKGRADRILFCLLRSCPKLNYAPIEKLVLAFVFATKRLRRYFQAHPIVVITDQPIKQIISRPDTAGRLQKWSVMLGEHNITYRPRTSVKGQILTDFLVEKPNEAPPDTLVVKTPQESWTLFTDGSSCVDGSGAGLILTSPEGTEFTYALQFQFTASNNEAEYEALIAGLRIVTQMGVHNLYVSVDSKLVVNQFPGTYIAKEENMVKYLEKAKNLISGFANFSISQVRRSKNKKADTLSKIAPTSFAHLSKQVLVEVLKEKSIQEKEVATVVEEEGPTWMTPIVEYLRDGTLPDDKKEASKLHYVIREIHKGSCSMHAELRSVIAKAMRLGYYWPTMHQDARLSAGPFPEGPGKVKFLIVAMDYFIKWIEAKVVATITGNQVKKFVWDNIVCRFGLLGEIVSDNERENRSLGEGIKARLGEGNKNWIEELPHVLWAHRTMIKSSYGDTPFSLIYGMEAVIPVKIGMPTYRTAAVDAAHNNEELRLNLDLLEERGERAAIREA
ncbi:reverse transcriptase domain-containing protein [Tanacetum coccineum]